MPRNTRIAMFAALACLCFAAMALALDQPGPTVAKALQLNGKNVLGTPPNLRDLAGQTSSVRKTPPPAAPFLAPANRRVISSAGPAAAGSPEGSGDVTVISHHDWCAYTGMVMNAGRNISTSTDPYTNGADDYIAIMYDPTQFTAGTATTVFQVDKVEALLINAFAEGMTFPQVMLCGSIDDGSGVMIPDTANPLAVENNYVPNIVPPSAGAPFGWAEVPNLAGTIVTDGSLPIWVVYHLPPGEVSGLPFDCGTLRNCPDYIDPSSGYLMIRGSLRWGNFFVYSADDPDAPNEWLGPMRMTCTDGTNYSFFGGVVNLTISDVTASADDLLQWNSSIVDALIKCANPGVTNPDDPNPDKASCADPTQFTVNSDIVFLSDWAVNGALPTPLAASAWQVYNVTNDPGRTTPVFETGTIFNENGPGNCVESNEATWQPGGGTLVNVIPYEDQLTWSIWSFPDSGDYEACLTVKHAHCNGDDYAPEPDGFPLDNFYNDVVDPANMPCMRFSLGGCDLTTPSSITGPNSLRAVKTTATNTHLEWDSAPSGNPFSVAIQIAIAAITPVPNKATIIPGLFAQSPPRLMESTLLSAALPQSIMAGQIIYIQMCEYVQGCGCKPDP